MRMHHCKWLLAAGLVAGVAAAYHSRADLEQWFRRHQVRFDGFEQVPASETYLLEQDRWLEFDIPKDTPLARLVGNAVLSSTNPAAPDTEWPYAIQYQLRSRHGLSSGVYHFKGQRVLFLHRETGKPAEMNSFLDQRYLPLSGRQLMLNLEDPAFKDATVLRLRLHSRHPDLLMVTMRVYFRTTVPERKIAYLWDRLNDDQKRDLARGNVYSVEGINEHEKFCLLQYHWEVGSPRGIPGRDFERRSIYIRDDSERLREVKDWVPAGLAVDADHFGVLPITNVPGSRQLQLKDYASVAPGQVISNTLWWHGAVQPKNETNYLTWSGNLRTPLPTNGEGLVQISSTRPVYVRAYQAEQGRTNEITPKPEHLLTFLCSPTNSVEYDVEHVGEESTFLRVDLRRDPPSPTHSGASPALVHYALLAADETALQDEDVLLTNSFSAFDWLVTSNGLADISVPQSLCFILPPEIRTLRISSPDGTVFVNAYSRPAQLVKRVRVPEDYSPAGMRIPAQLSWFTVRPRDQLQRRQAALTAIVRVQTRPADLDPLVLAGQYEWDSFQPVNDSRGQMVLLPPTEGLPARPESIGYSYFPVAIGQQRVRFQAPPWQSQVAPSLMLVCTNGSGGPTTVRLDGQTLLDSRLDSPVTAIRLGNLAAGEHELNINSPNSVLAYLNYLAPATNAAFLQRYCTMASSNALSFSYTKVRTNDEVLVLRVFSPAGSNPEPFEVQFNLKAATSRGLGPFPSITLTEREATVTPSPAGQTWLVADATAQLDGGQPVFFPIGPDLPPGQYEVQVKVAAASPRWLSLSRTTPGLAEKLKLTSEQNIY